MDFGLSEDQLLLEQTVRSFLADKVPIGRVRELREKDCPNDRTIYRELEPETPTAERTYRHLRLLPPLCRFDVIVFGFWRQHRRTRR